MELNLFEDFYKGKRVFLTGHTGFKGAWMLEWLCGLGAFVKGYALAAEGNENLFDIVALHNNFEHVVGDIRNKSLLEVEVINFKPDIIFHLAAQPLVRKAYKIPAETFEVNVMGTVNILDAVTKLPNKCTVIVVTTDKVYENKEQDYCYVEEDRLGGYDPYSASKAAAEIVIRSYRQSFFNVKNYYSHKKCVVSARAGNVIGGGDFSTDRIVPDIVRALQNNRPIEVRNPNSVRPWQHVLEPLHGYLKLAMLAYNNHEVVADAYNFGPLANDHLTVKVLVEKAIATWGSGNWLDTSNGLEVHEARLLMLNIKKATKDLNWKPLLNSNEAIGWTMEWYKNIEIRHEITIAQIVNYTKFIK